MEVDLAVILLLLLQPAEAVAEQVQVFIMRVLLEQPQQHLVDHLYMLLLLILPVQHLVVKAATRRLPHHQQTVQHLVRPMAGQQGLDNLLQQRAQVLAVQVFMEQAVAGAADATVLDQQH